LVRSFERLMLSNVDFEYFVELLRKNKQIGLLPGIIKLFVDNKKPNLIGNYVESLVKLNQENFDFVFNGFILDEKDQTKKNTPIGYLFGFLIAKDNRDLIYKLIRKLNQTEFLSVQVNQLIEKKYMNAAFFKGLQLHIATEKAEQEKEKTKGIQELLQTIPENIWAISPEDEDVIENPAEHRSWEQYVIPDDPYTSGRKQ